MSCNCDENSLDIQAEKLGEIFEWQRKRREERTTHELFPTGNHCEFEWKTRQRMEKRKLFHSLLTLLSSSFFSSHSIFDSIHHHLFSATWNIEEGMGWVWAAEKVFDIVFQSFVKVVSIFIRLSISYKPAVAEEKRKKFRMREEHKKHQNEDIKLSLSLSQLSNIFIVD